MTVKWPAALLVLGLSLTGAAAQQPLPPAAGCQAAERPAVATGASTLGRDGYLFRPSSDFRSDWAVPEATRRGLAALEGALRRRGTRLVFVSPPTRGIVLARHLDPGNPLQAAFDPAAATAGHRAYLEAVRSLGPLVPDIPGAIGGSGLGNAYFTKRDNHWSPEGSRLTAGLVADLIKAEPAYRGLEKAAFTTGLAREETWKGQYALAVELLCRVKLAPETARRFVTRPREAAPAGLLGATRPAEVVLAGTSFGRLTTGLETDYDFNFDGFLAEFLSLPVLNVSVRAGDIDTAMLGYLASDAYLEHAPAFLVWEVGGYYSLDKPAFYRQAVASAHGPCREAEALANAAVRSAGGQGEVELFRAGAGQAVGGAYLFLESSDRLMNNFSLVTTHADGKTDEVKVTRQAGSLGSGRYFLAFDEAIRSPVARVVLRPSGGPAASLRVRLCRQPGG